MNISFDADKLYELMEHFYILTKIRMVIFDDNFNQILSLPQYDCDFCRELKNSAKLKSRCMECDKNARQMCLRTNSIHIYTCHAGLAEAISPLRINGVVLGYIMLGQIIDKDKKKKNKENILEYVQKYLNKNLEEEYGRLTTKNKMQIEAAANIMEACACYLWVNHLVKVNEDCMSVLIAEYINNNLTNDLSVDALCRRFNISRNKLYKIARDSYGMGIAAYVRKQRVQNAASLLKNGSSVANAAINSGFDDYNYFSGIFKREMGSLPSKYAHVK